MLKFLTCRSHKYGSNDISTVRAILLENKALYSSELMDQLISAVANTIMVSKESISLKIDAIALLICVVIKYPDDFLRNKEIFEKIYEQREAIEVNDNSIISSNIDSISLKIGLRFLFSSMKKDMYSEVLELMPYIKDDVSTTIVITNLIVKWLYTSDEVVLQAKVESIILQNVLHWLKSEHLDIRWNATRILLALSRNPENQGVINHQLVSLIESESVYIKNLILRGIHKIEGIEDTTKEYIITKCKNDPNYVVRMVCLEIE